MTDTGASAARSDRLSNDAPAPASTFVELTWLERRIETWIRFGHHTSEKIIDRHRRVLGFPANTVFCFVRWAANDFSTIVSRLDIVRAVDAGEPCQTVPFVRPGGDILLKIAGWPKVERMLHLIDAVEARGIDPADVSPDHWRHVRNRLAAGQEPRAYSVEQHRAFLLRRRVEP
ncbi:DUF2840 domain-containing protein [Xanthobacter versatilis]|uniref:DUF2840 domain-containing protein n=1 Tax=Xanthobacter autotrophicus (strain ATCC BAA-1158 / Py2) TaxID=78245 RepID=UPI00372BCABF